MNSDCDACGFFDDVVIGSSPLMLLQAEYLARNNRTVCVVDRQLQFGGVWGVAHLSNGQITECAVHLLENYPGVYKYLEEVSGCEFVKLDPQPIRVFRNGLTLSLSNPVIFVLDGLYLTYGWLQTSLRALFGNQTCEHLRSIIRGRMVAHFRRRTRFLFVRQVYRGPEHGWDQFVCNLIERLRTLGVVFKTMEVSEIHLTASKTWVVKGVSGKSISASEVFSTTSTNLSQVSSGKLVAAQSQSAERVSLLVEVPLDNIRRAVTFLSERQNHLFPRVARVKIKGTVDAVHYLVELGRFADENVYNLFTEVSEFLTRRKILRRGGVFQILTSVPCSYSITQTHQSAKLKYSGITLCHSLGNLAAGIARWQTTVSHNSPTKSHPKDHFNESAKD